MANFLTSEQALASIPAQPQMFLFRGEGVLFEYDGNGHPQMTPMFGIVKALANLGCKIGVVDHAGLGFLIDLFLTEIANVSLFGAMGYEQQHDGIFERVPFLHVNPAIDETMRGMDEWTANGMWYRNDGCAFSAGFSHAEHPATAHVREAFSTFAQPLHFEMTEYATPSGYRIDFVRTGVANQGQRRSRNVDLRSEWATKMFRKMTDDQVQDLVLVGIENTPADRLLLRGCATTGRLSVALPGDPPNWGWADAGNIHLPGGQTVAERREYLGELLQSVADRLAWPGA